VGERCEGGPGDGCRGEGVLRAHGAEFLTVVAAEAAVQLEQLRVGQMWSSGGVEEVG
jgi:hypothetical protein